MKRYESEWWTITFPDEWQAEEGEDAVVIFSEQRVGSIHVSAARNGNGTVTDADLCDFAMKHLDAGAKTKDVVCGDFTGFSFHFGTNDMYQRQWWLSCDDTMVFATYTSPQEHKGKEETTVDSILISLQKR